MVRLVALMENTRGGQRGLYTEHGLSFYLETPHTKLIFDFGESGKMLDNLIKLNIPYDMIHCAVCSHGHYDHGGGIKYVLPQLNLHKIVTGKGFWTPKYKTDGHKYAYLGTGLTPKMLQQYGVQHTVCENTLQLTEDCWAVTDFERTTSYEKIPERFVLETSPGCFVPDPFQDEICLVVDTGKGLAVIAGCSHPGIINMLHTVQKRFEKPIESVWGGAHLVEASEEQIKYTACALKELGLKRIGLCHCSGEQLAQLKDYVPEIECCRIGTGDMVLL